MWIIRTLAIITYSLPTLANTVIASIRTVNDNFRKFIVRKSLHIIQQQLSLRAECSLSILGSIESITAYAYHQGNNER